MHSDRKDRLAARRAERGSVRNGVETLRLSGSELSTLLQAVLEQGAPFTFRAAGGSMFPFIRDGDLVTVSSLHGEPAQLGQVVACVVPAGGKLVVHRVVGRHGQRYLVRGDAALAADGWVNDRQVLGRVTRIVRDGKERSLGLGRERVLVAALTRSGLLSAVALPLARVIHGISGRAAS